jgi:hypothetical protein
MVHPGVGTLLGKVSGLSAGYNLGAGAGKYLGFKLAERGAEKGPGAEVWGGIVALGLMLAGRVVGTLTGGLGGATLVGRLLRESA